MKSKIVRLAVVLALLVATLAVALVVGALPVFATSDQPPPVPVGILPILVALAMVAISAVLTFHWTGRVVMVASRRFTHFVVHCPSRLLVALHRTPRGPAVLARGSRFIACGSTPT